jgi:hypothetical protein
VLAGYRARNAGNGVHPEDHRGTVGRTNTRPMRGSHLRQNTAPRRSPGSAGKGSTALWRNGNLIPLSRGRLRVRAPPRSRASHGTNRPARAGRHHDRQVNVTAETRKPRDLRSHGDGEPIGLGQGPPAPRSPAAWRGLHEQLVRMLTCPGHLEAQDVGFSRRSHRSESDPGYVTQLPVSIRWPVPDRGVEQFGSSLGP